MVKKVNKAKLGFTLIELLVVIAIIGVLASIVLASLNTARVKARDARRIADIKQIQLALELYADSSAGSGMYPVGTTSCNYPTTIRGLFAINPTQIARVPRDPSTAASATATGCYLYASGSGASTPNASYHIAATLEDVNNSALAGDRDCDSTSINTITSCFLANSTTGATVEAGFSGLDSAGSIFDLTN
jgi:prepilin-type N-terminal cleavage/methylation domain-containing protein